MATTTAKSATRANESKNAAAAAASVATTKSAAESRKSRIIVAGIPKPSESAKPDEKPEAAASPNTVQAGSPKRVDIESLTAALNKNGTAKLSEHATPIAQDEAPKTETPQAAPAPEAKPEPTAEERAAALQKEIEERTRQLQAALTDLARKKELNDHRTRFLKTLDELRAAEEQLNQEDEFSSNDVCKIAFQGKPDGYRWETIFSIGNADLQREFITFIRKKIRAKVDEIEAELIK